MFTAALSVIGKAETTQMSTSRRVDKQTVVCPHISGCTALTLYNHSSSKIKSKGIQNGRFSQSLWKPHHIVGYTDSSWGQTTTVFSNTAGSQCHQAAQEITNFSPLLPDSIQTFLPPNSGPPVTQRILLPSRIHKSKVRLQPCLVWLSGLDHQKQKRHQFDPQPGHMPGFRAGSLVGGTQEATH